MSGSRRWSELPGCESRALLRPLEHWIDCQLAGSNTAYRTARTVSHQRTMPTDSKKPTSSRMKIRRVTSTDVVYGGSGLRVLPNR